MNTHTKSALLPIAAIACLLLSSPCARAQDADQDAAAAEAFMKLISPGPEHQLLKTMVGSWTTKQTLFMEPGVPPVVNAGTAKFRMLMGGRYLVQNYQSEIPGMGEFEGRGTTAFDNATKEYVGTWLDSLSTGIMVSKGKAIDKNTISMVGESTDPISQQVVKFRTVSKYVSADRHEMEMYEQKAGAEERKFMQIVYTRVKAQPAESGTETESEK